MRPAIHDHNTTLMQRAGAVPSLCAFCCLIERAKMGVPVKRETKQNGWLFRSNKNGFVGSRREKKSNKNEINKNLVRVQPFSALRSWMNHGYICLRTVVCEYQMLLQQVPQINLRGSSVPSCPKTSSELKIPMPTHTEVLQQIPHCKNTLVRLLVSSFASWSWTLLKLELFPSLCSVSGKY